MKKEAKSTKAVSSKSVHAHSVEAAPAAATPAAAAPTPATVTTMADSAVQECSALLDQVVTKLGTQPALDVDQVRRATKMRKGGAEVIPKILALCQQHNVTQIGSLTVKEMSEQLQRGDALAQVGLRSGAVQKKVREAAMTAHGRSWQIGTTMYKTLQRMSVDDPELALGLQPVEEFFQTKRTKGKVRENKKARAAAKLAQQQAAANAGTATAAQPAPVTPPVAAPAPSSPSANGAAPSGAPAAPVNGAAH